MKKLIPLLFFCSAAFGQIKTVTVSETKTGGIELLHRKEIDLGKGDTLSFVVLSFQNEEYTAIKDKKYWAFSDTAQINKLVKNIKSALNEVGQKVSVRWDEKDYSVAVYDFNKAVYFYEPISKGKAHVSINKSQAEKMVKWLEAIKL